MSKMHIHDNRPASANGADYWNKLLNQQDIDPALFIGSCSEEQKKQLFRNYVSVINIEAFNFCNRKCSYCPVSILDDRRGKIKHMSEEVYNKLINNLSEIEYSEKLVYNLYNEPLASKKIFYHKLRYATQYLPKARLFFNSNGDYLDIEALEDLSQIGVTGINVTLHPKGDYQHDDRYAALVEFYEKVNQLLIVESQVVGESIRSHFMYNNMRVDVSCVNYEEVGHSRAGAIEHLIIKELRDYPCFRPFREFTVYHNGYVYPCCNIMPDLDEGNKLAIGHLESELSIFDLYASQIMQNWRKSLITFGPKKSPCDLCYERTCTVDDKDRSKREQVLNTMLSEESK